MSEQPHIIPSTEMVSDPLREAIEWIANFRPVGEDGVEWAASVTRKKASEALAAVSDEFSRERVTRRVLDKLLGQAEDLLGRVISGESLAGSLGQDIRSFLRYKAGL